MATALDRNCSITTLIFDRNEKPLFQQTFTCSKSTLETLEKDVQYVQYRQ